MVLSFQNYKFHKISSRSRNNNSYQTAQVTNFCGNKTANINVKKTVAYVRINSKVSNADQKLQK